MTDEARQRRSALAVAIALLVVVSMYLFSYAPVVRLKGSWKVYRTTDLAGNPATVKAPIYGADLPMYRPVDWLIDNTPLRDPLIWWAGVCGVRGPFVEAMMWRPRGTRP